MDNQGLTVNGVLFYDVGLEHSFLTRANEFFRDSNIETSYSLRCRH